MRLRYLASVRLLDDRERSPRDNSVPAPCLVPPVRGPLHQGDVSCVHEPDKHDVLRGHHPRPGGGVLQTT